MQTIVGISSWTRRLRQDIERVARHSATVLISGPTGTGKELIARAIHQQSTRRNHPFIPVDCAALTSTLFASQLFGHRKGAFTGAEYEALGCFRAADGGTLFLDELGELSPELQAKLLRVIQERAVVPVGSHQEAPVDVRIVAATNRDLKQEVIAGRFRGDLYFRIAVVVLEAVPLCERSEDIDVLAEHFLQEMAQQNGLPAKTLSDEARQIMQVFPWPGNVRQLRHILEQAVIRCDETVISAGLMQQILRQATFPDVSGNEQVEMVQTLAAPTTFLSPLDNRPVPLWQQTRTAMPDDTAVPASMAPGHKSVPQPGRNEKSIVDFESSAGVRLTSERNHWKTLSDLERDHILNTLAHTYNNQSAAARLLGVTRQALIRKIKKYDIQLSSKRPPLSQEPSTSR